MHYIIFIVLIYISNGFCNIVVKQKCEFHCKGENYLLKYLNFNPKSNSIRLGN